MMLLFGKPSQEPLPVTRNKTGVIAIVKKAPAGRQPLEWWIEFLKASW